MTEEKEQNYFFGHLLLALIVFSITALIFCGYRLLPIHRPGPLWVISFNATGIVFGVWVGANLFNDMFPHTTLIKLYKKVHARELVWTSVIYFIFLAIALRLHPWLHSNPNDYKDSEPARELVRLSAYTIPVFCFLVPLYWRSENRREPRVFCPKCKHFTSREEPWLCGFCKKVNNNTGRFHFLYQCEFCDEVPEHYLCPHCTHPIQLGQRDSITHPAQQWQAPAALVPIDKDAPHKERILEIRQAKEFVQSQNELAAELLKYNRNEEALKQIRAIPEKARSKREQLEHDLSLHEDQHLGIYEIARAKLAEAEKKYANDPDELQRYREMMTKWLRKNT